MLQGAGTADEAALQNIWLFDSNIGRERQGPAPGLTEFFPGAYTVYPFPESRLLLYRNGKLSAGKEVYLPSFDSNFLGRLSKFFSGEKCPDVMSLLERMRAWARCDPQSYIGVLEHLAKVDNPMPQVVRIVENILRLHALDLEVTLAAEKPYYDKETESRQKGLWGGGDFYDRAVAASKHLALPTSTRDNVTQIYAALLKMVQIKYVDRHRTYEEMCVLFDDFVEQTLQLENLRLHIVARWVFSDRIQWGLRIQRNTAHDKVRSKLRATAWDIYIAGTPERVLSFKQPPFGVLAVLITGDKALAQIASIFQVRQVAVFLDRGIRTDLHVTEPFLVGAHGRDAVEQDMARLLSRFNKPYRNRELIPVDVISLESSVLPAFASR